MLRAQVFTYSRSRGAFAGIDLKGAVLQPDKNDGRTSMEPGSVVGHEISGMIEEVGENVTSIQTGDSRWPTTAASAMHWTE
jgi:lipid-binding SYLF domain-containing protein